MAAYVTKPIVSPPNMMATLAAGTPFPVIKHLQATQITPTSSTV